MGAGKYRERVLIQARGGEPDKAGARTEWSTVATRRAEVVATGGREGMRGRQLQATADYVVTMRDDPETRRIGPSMRLVWRVHTLNIESVLFDGREIRLQCKAQA